MRKCNKCNQWLNESSFSKDNRSKSGLQTECAKCRKGYYQKNKERILQNQKEYHNRPEIKKYIKEYRERNRDKRRAQFKKYYLEHAKKLREKRRTYHQLHRDEENRKGRIRNREYYQKNKKQLLEKYKEYRNRPEVRAKIRQYRKRWREQKSEYNKNYRKNNLEKCKELDRLWQEKNKEHRKAYMKEFSKAYRQTEHGKEMKKNWNKYNPDKVREMDRRKGNNRRSLGFVPLMVNPFPDMPFDYHHINNMLVVPLPKTIHNSLPNTPVETHRKLANEWIEKLYCMDVTNILSPYF